MSEVKISHPEKVLFPEPLPLTPSPTSEMGNGAQSKAGGITKGELGAYYETMAPLMLPYIQGRPVTMERYPNGLDEEWFYQKNVSRGFPEWLERVNVPKKGGSVNYPLANDERSIVWMANQNSITPHVWTSRVPDLWLPDLLVFDLDPLEDEPVVLRSAAIWVRDVLGELGMPTWVKTSGSKGYHIVAPIDGKTGYDEVETFCHGVSAELVRRHPEHLTQEILKAERGNRILIDIGRNGPGATFAATYSVRARPGAPVSAPCSWGELEEGSVTPQGFTLRTMAARLDAVGELWDGMFAKAVSLKEPMERLVALGPISSMRQDRFGRARDGGRFGSA